MDGRGVSKSGERWGGCPFLESEDLQQMASPIRVFIWRARTAGFHKVGPDQALSRRAPAELSCGRPRPAPRRRAPPGPSADPTQDFIGQVRQTHSRWAPTGFPYDRQRPDSQTAGPNRAFIRRVLVRPSVSAPRPGFYTAGPSWAFSQRAPTRISHDGPSVDPRPVGPSRAFIPRAPAGLIIQ